MVGFFIERPVFASAIAVIMVLAGIDLLFPAAGLAVSRDHAAAGRGDRHLSGRQRPGRRRHRDDAARAADQRRAGHDLHVVVELQRRLARPSPSRSRSAIPSISLRSTCRTAFPRRRRSLPPIVNQAGVTIKKQNPNIRPARQSHLARRLRRSGDAQQLRLSADRRSAEAPARASATCSIFGERRYSMRVWLDPDKLATLGITAVDVQNAIAEQNIQVAAGKIGQSPAPPGTAFEMQVNALGRLSDPAQFGDIVVRANPATGSAVRLRDVARIELGALQYTSTAFSDDKPTVVLGDLPDAGLERARPAAAASRPRWRSSRSASPKAIDYAMHYDTTRFVSASMHDVVDHAGRGAAPRRRRGLHLPAELAHHDHPDDRHPGVAHRDARRDGGCSASRSTWSACSAWCWRSGWSSTMRSSSSRTSSDSSRPA